MTHLWRDEEGMECSDERSCEDERSKLSKVFASEVTQHGDGGSGAPRAKKQPVVETARPWLGVQWRSRKEGKGKSKGKGKCKAALAKRGQQGSGKGSNGGWNGAKAGGKTGKGR